MVVERTEWHAGSGLSFLTAVSYFLTSVFITFITFDCIFLFFPLYLFYFPFLAFLSAFFLLDCPFLSLFHCTVTLSMSSFVFALEIICPFEDKPKIIQRFHNVLSVHLLICIFISIYRICLIFALNVQ